MSNTSKPYKKKTNTYSKNHSNKNIQETNLAYLLPVIFTIAILPFIVKIHTYATNLTQFSWFSSEEYFTDFFLYYKQKYLILTAAIMLLIIVYHSYIQRKKPSMPVIFIPLCIYAILTILSSVFSRYRSYTLTGSFEQFESVFVLLAYCIITYYTYTYVKSEHSVKLILNALLASVILLSLLGLSQLTGHDFYNTRIGLNLIASSAYANDINITAGFKRVYLSLYNSNYVGVYASMVTPLLFYMILFLKNIRLKIVSGAALIGILVSLYGSSSTAGFIATTITLCLSIVFLWRYLKKYFYITIPSILIAVAALFFLNSHLNNYIGREISKFTNIQKSVPALTEIQTNDDNILIKYNNNILKIMFICDANNICNFVFLDDNNTVLPSTLDSTNGTYTITDDRYAGFMFTPTQYNDIIGFTVPLAGKTWFFTNQAEDHTYYFLNPYNKLIKMASAPSALFTGYEGYASNRGYIWSRTLPLLKNKLLLGSGADTFLFEFPQNDYVNLYNYGFFGQIMSKPHCLYLQMAVQTGVLSVICFLAFYLIYFISSIRIYINGKFDNFYSIIGCSIFLGSIGYMICGISNDSSITIAPVFWILIGMGLSLNQIVKQHKNKLQDMNK